jgi:adenine-specific DNA-methyltransferase
MKLHIRKIRQALNPAYRKQTVTREAMEAFKLQLRSLFQHVNPDESEENAKGHFAVFLRSAFYGNDYLVATKERADLVIHNGPKADSPAAVLLEIKRPQSDGKPAAHDMLRTDQPNVKALHELILYFLRERIEAHNTDLKYLIVTDVREFFVFDAADFERLFFKNRSLLKEYKDWRDGRKTAATTEFFYQQIAQPFVEQIEEELPCTHFDLREFSRAALNDDLRDDHELIPLFKLLAPTHLLRLPFANDSNSLNKDFYYELLHLIGLEETKDGNKKVIRRKPESQRDAGSLLENAIRTLLTEERLDRVSRRSNYGNDTSEQLFGVALELCITWVNRILFLKLLEAQLLQYHNSDPAYRFLHSGLIKDYDEINELFFEVLAKQASERADYTRERFGRVPYLNSSLFEITVLESETIRINSMKDRFELPLFARSVLKDDKGRRRAGSMPVLEYLFAFLDAYNFSSEGSESIREDNKTLINASVLGLIFEKINGYQDGAFFTPGFITMYICRETLRRAVVQKFRDSGHFHDFNFDSFDDLRNYLHTKHSAADLQQANALVNSLKICDPAVGSGHFLVSALNELLAIKSELSILCDRDGNRLPVRVEVANDELNVQWRLTDELFAYRPGVRDSQTVQQALFHEKQTLIEGCLFGVDLNPNSVKICRLRLWIELLKNAYYKEAGSVQTGHAVETGHALSLRHAKSLETLPNIDINIKQGNSLVSRFALDEDLRPVLKQKNTWNIADYRLAVAGYHSARNKDDKRELLAQIERIKSDFQTHIANNDPRIKLLSKLRGQKYLIDNKTEIGDLFGKLSEKDVSQDLQKIEAQIAKVETEVESIRSAFIFRDAFEWRFEFPEVLNEDGEFTGFDVVVGNPPYIRQEEFSELKPYLKERFETFAGTADLLVYFIERAHQVLAPNGQFSFIISNKFMRAGFGKPLREWLAQRRLLEIVDFGDLPVFEEATTYPCILSWQKAEPTGSFRAANVPEMHIADFQQYLPTITFNSLQSALTPEGWTLANYATQQLLDKLRRSGKPLGEYVKGKIYYGIKTGFNEAFVIDEATKDRLIAEDPRSAEVVKPFLAGRDVKRYQAPRADKYLIFTRRGIDIEQYPALKAHLEQYRTQLEPRPADWKGKTEDWPGRKPGSYKWYEIQDSVDYYQEFEKEKIVYPNICKQPEFTMDSEEIYTNQKCFIIPCGDRALLGILNSSLFFFLFRNILPKLRGDFYEPSSIYFKLFPIVSEDSDLYSKIETLATEIMKLKQSSPAADTTQLESEIDRLVYALYGLTEAEIALVEGGAVFG